MKTEELIIGVCGMVLASVVFFVVLKVMRKGHSVIPEYDERQKRVQGDGFKYAFLTLIFYNFFTAFLMTDLILEKPIMDMTMMLMLGTCIGLGVYVCYCIWNEGYISLKDTPKKVMILLSLLCVLDIAVGIGIGCKGKFVENGVLTFRCAPFASGILGIVILVVMAVKIAMKRKEEE